MFLLFGSGIEVFIEYLVLFYGIVIIVVTLLLSKPIVTYLFLVFFSIYLLELFVNALLFLLTLTKVFEVALLDTHLNIVDVLLYAIEL